MKFHHFCPKEERSIMFHREYFSLLVYEVTIYMANVTRFFLCTADQEIETVETLKIVLQFSNIEIKIRLGNNKGRIRFQYKNRIVS